MLAKATAAFGDVPVRRLLPDEIGRWAKRLPEGHRHDAMVALRQVLNAAVRWKVIEENPARLVPNPLPARWLFRLVLRMDGVVALATAVDRGRPTGPEPVELVGWL